MISTVVPEKAENIRQTNTLLQHLQSNEHRLPVSPIKLPCGWQEQTVAVRACVPA